MLARSFITVILIASFGCASSTYYPSEPGIYTYWRNGQRHWIKNGQPLDIGGALSGLDEAMSEVPAAAGLAHEAHASATTGNVWFAAAIALLVGGLIVGASDDHTRENVGFGIAMGGLVSDFIALGYYQASAVHSSDAANLYNARMREAAVSVPRSAIEDTAIEEPGSPEQQ